MLGNVLGAGARGGHGAAAPIEVCPAPPRAYSMWGGPRNVGDLHPTAVFVEEEWFEFGSQEVAEGLWHKVATFPVPQIDLSSLCYFLARRAGLYDLLSPRR